MITIQTVMLVALGFFIAGLAVFLFAPFYRRRAARLAVDELRRTMPLTSAEIRADKDRLRAEYALAQHKLEMKVEQATHSAAKQMVEINRRDAAISALEGEMAKLRASLEEHENARRVLELTITDRLPKVEFRLSEAKRLLFQRDKEIAALTHSANRQQAALEEAAQINAQQRDEMHRLNATLATRAARNRESLADPRFDGEVALRAEIEALRTKAREQAQLIGRLQSGLAKPARAEPVLAAPPPTLLNGHVGSESKASGLAADTEPELARLRRDLAEAEFALKSARGMAEAGQAGHAALETEMRRLRIVNEDQSAEVARLKAALKAYESEDSEPKALKESKVSMLARVSALKAESDENAVTIQRLRSEIAAANEKLARQAAHFMDEMRRLGVGTLPTGARREADRPAKRSLVDRISAPRPPRDIRAPATARPAEPAKTGDDPQRVSGFLRALDGAAGDGSDVAADASEAKTGGEGASDGKPRRAGLIERITGIEKPVTPGSAAE